MANKENGLLESVGEPEIVPEEGIRIELFSEPYGPLDRSPSGVWEWGPDGPVRVGGKNDGKTASQIRQENAPCSCPVPYGVRAVTIHKDGCKYKKSKGWTFEEK